ncbi:hypothetical protein WK76_24960 [Burkholderia ubonensis]|uniref:lytic transglycosylase domain-containing protein n=1 Tax=Burkholderia ubonensis TaxID=101571 RepID=UPI00075D22BF|nr:lytic transglycosylase domain-containing protein [Burkholderia ubonensis]KVU84280.1 hypothetical protein WK76_24960 [Burkholderia ubonensis]
MVAMDFAALAQQCASQVAPTTLAAIVRTESGFNPFAIGVVGGRLARQPRTLEEAVATADALERRGWNYSVGLSQVNRSHFAQYGLSTRSAFDVCRNLHAGADILSRCYASAVARRNQPQIALRDGLSCYYSGNFATGYRAGYVQRVVMNAAQLDAGAVVPAIDADQAVSVRPAAKSSEKPPAMHTPRVESRPDANPMPSTVPSGEQTAPESNSAVIF